MKTDPHERARSLIAVRAVEGIDEGGREWLEQHLEECAECAANARTTAAALLGLKSTSVTLPPDLAARTQMRIHLRALEATPRRHGWALWMSFAISWLLGVASAPWVWRGFEWVGQVSGLPTLWLKLAFGLWWGLPAALAAGIWALEKRQIEES